MSYQSDKAFLANKVYAITAQDETLKTVFTAPSGSRWQTELVDSQSNGYQGALLKNLDTGITVEYLQQYAYNPAQRQPLSDKEQQ